MAAHIHGITIDCLDSQPVAAFWMAALGYDIAARDGTWVQLRDPRGVGPLLSIDPVPESKIVKNRVHLDLRPDDTMEAEVARLERLGAHQVRVVSNDGRIHTVMADPEGNEFCVIQP
jgi:hypothetical protein